MKISTAQADQSVKRNFEITESHPIVPMASSRAGKKVRIESGSIEYTWQDGEWVVDSRWSVKLHGVVLLKDGGDSKNEHTRHPEHEGWRKSSPWTEQFEWIQPIIDLLRPAGGPTMTELRNHEA